MKNTGNQNLDHSYGRSWFVRITTWIFFIILFAWFLYAAESDHLFHVDEGIHLASARQVLEGGMPGIDFNYPKPGVYLTAAWLMLAGRSLTAIRFLVTMQIWLIAVILFSWIRRRQDLFHAFLGTAIFSICAGPLWPIEGGDWTGVVLVISGYWMLDSRQDDLKNPAAGRYLKTMGPGLTFSLAGCFFPDLAVFSIISGVVILSLNRSRKNHIQLWAFLGSALVPAAIVALLLLAGGALRDFLDMGVAGPFSRWHQFHEMFLPPPVPFMKSSRFAFYGDTTAARLLYLLPLAVALYMVFLLFDAFMHKGRTRDHESGKTITIESLMALSGLLTMYPRADLDHLAPAMGLMLPLAVRLLKVPVRHGSVEAPVGAHDARSSGWAGLARWPILAAGLCGTGLMLVAGTMENASRLDFDRAFVQGIPCLEGFPMRPKSARELNSLNKFLRHNVKQGELVFAYPDFSYFYFLFDMPPPTRFLDQMFGWIGKRETDEVVRDLERFHVRYAVKLDVNRPMDGSPLSSYAPRLTNYMKEKFVTIAVIGRFKVLKRATALMQ
ncbi:MAG: hypothetical protein GXP49_06835 [Deltaproteobacteria bacterium]|nr:hypothetical protein [Deltaproteobacteria bacterium]